jgi:small subunit ribosomal protein S1
MTEYLPFILNIILFIFLILECIIQFILHITVFIGGRNSSNTKKLYELSKDLCENTFLIQNYKEIPYNYIDKNTIVGVSAGASTPDWVIEEVISMLENLNDKVNEMNEDAEKTEILEETLETDKVDLAEEKAEEGEHYRFPQP